MSYRHIAATAALAVAGLTATAPIASAAPGDPVAPPPGSGNVELLNGLNLLPVQACGLGIPILSGILDSPDGTCAVNNDAASD